MNVELLHEVKGIGCVHKSILLLKSFQHYPFLRSWVSVVAFDPYTTTYGDTEDGDDCNTNNQYQVSTLGVCSCDAVNSVSSGGTAIQCPTCRLKASPPLSNNKSNSNSQANPSQSYFFGNNRQSRNSESAALRLSVTENTRLPACYRLGSVSQDTQLCLWDLTEDILKQPFGKSRPTTNNQSGRTEPSPIPHHAKGSNQMNGKSSPPRMNSFPTSGSKGQIDKDVVDSVVVGKGSRSNGGASSSENGNNGQSHGILSLRFPIAFRIGDKESKLKEHRRNFSLGSKGEKSQNGTSKTGNSPAATDSFLHYNLEDPLKLIGTQACPRLDECPLLEPLICKKISHERLTSLIFRSDSIITACQDGIICTWARPGEEFRIPSYRKKFNPTSLAQENIFNRFYSGSKAGSVEPL